MSEDRRAIVDHFSPEMTHNAYSGSQMMHNRRAALVACSMHGDGQNVHCDNCGELLSEVNLSRWDHDGNAWCRECRPAPKRPGFFAAAIRELKGKP